MTRMLKQFPRKEAEDNSRLRSYTWRESWIRPYESLYSVFNTFKRLNTFSDTNAIRALTNDPQCFAYAGILINTMYHSCLRANDRRYIYRTDRILIDAFASDKETSLFPRLDDAARPLLMSPRYKHCPECDKLGYHSWMFQYSLVRKCPIHNIPLIEGDNVDLNQLKNMIDKHPALNSIDTDPIDKVYNKTLKGIIAVQAIRLNSFYSGKSLSKTPIKPLLNIGEEIYCAKTDNTRNIRNEMSEKFMNLIFSLHDQLSENFRYDIALEENKEYHGLYINAKNILSTVFGDRPERTRDNPIFKNTFATDLQIYISFLELLSEEKTNMILLSQYLCEIFAYQNPMDFRRLFNPYSGILTWYNRTPAYIGSRILKGPEDFPTLNENSLILSCIDDHVKYQWNYIKTHFAKYIDEDSLKFKAAYTPGDNKLFKDLPHLMYLLIIDDGNIGHVLRLVE